MKSSRARLQGVLSKFRIEALIDLACRRDGAGFGPAFPLPEAGAGKRFLALIINTLDFHLDDGARRFSLHGETGGELFIGKDRGAAIDAQGFADARHEEEQGDARIAHDVL